MGRGGEEFLAAGTVDPGNLRCTTFDAVKLQRMVKAVGPAATHGGASGIRVRGAAVVGAFEYDRQTAAAGNGDITFNVIQVAVGHVDRIAGRGRKRR